MLSAPFAIAADALSFLGSAFFLGRIQPAEPPADDGAGSVTAGARFIAGSALVRASLIAVATINFFNLMFAALYLLYAVRVLHIKAGLVGVLSARPRSAAARLGRHQAHRGAIGVGWAYSAGCLLFTTPLLLWPLRHGPRPLVLAMLFLAEFGSGSESCCWTSASARSSPPSSPTAAGPGDRRVPGRQLRHPAARRAARRALGSVIGLRPRCGSRPSAG